MEPRARRVSVKRRLLGPSERLEIRDDATGRVLAIRPESVGEANGSFGTRHEAILSIAKAARWRVEHVLLAWSASGLAAKIALASDEARIKLDARPVSALRLALASSAPVSIEDGAWDELVRRAAPIPSEGVSDFAAELERRPAEDILRLLGQEPPTNDVA